MATLQKALQVFKKAAEEKRQMAKGPYIEGPEPSEREIREMLKAASGSQEGTWIKIKKDDSWGVRVDWRARSGEPVTVVKRNGQSTKVTLGDLVWTNNKDVWIFRVQSRSSGGGGGRRPNRGRYECEECREYVMPGTECWETGMMH